MLGKHKFPFTMSKFPEIDDCFEESSNDMFDMWRINANDNFTSQNPVTNNKEFTLPLPQPLSPYHLDIDEIKIEPLSPQPPDVFLDEVICSYCIKCRNIIKDCMLSSIKTEETEDKKMHQVKDETKLNSKCTCSRRNRDVSFTGENCVSPTAVFPYAVNDKSASTNISNVTLIKQEVEDPLPNQFTVKFCSLANPTSDSEDSINNFSNYFDDLSDVYNEDDEEEENDNDEIDVVSINCNNEIDESMLEKDEDCWSSRLNEAASLYATVAAMHNYTQAPKKSISMPPSPAITTQQTISRSSRKMKRKIFSSPPSPVYKRQRRSLTRSDLYKVAKRIGRSNHHQEDIGKRAQHNVLERQRRVDLRMSFEHLKKLVPTNGKDRMSKVNILRYAAQYCRNLTKKHDNLEKQVQTESDRHNRLKRRLEDLQRNAKRSTVLRR